MEKPDQNLIAEKQDSKSFVREAEGKKQSRVSLMGLRTFGEYEH